MPDFSESKREYKGIYIYDNGKSSNKSLLSVLVIMFLKLIFVVTVITEQS